MNIQQAVILAGGLGTRLKPLTDTLPKCLAPIRGKPFLHYLLNHLAREGLTEVLLLVGYQGEMVKTFVGDGASWGVKATCIQEPALLGTGGALKHAASHLAETFLVANGDTWLPISYESAIRCFMDKKADGVLVVCPQGQEGLGIQPNLHVNVEGKVLGYRQGVDGPLYRFVDGGVSVFRKTVLQDIPEGVSSLGESVYRAAIGRGDLWAWRSPKRFYDLGTPNQLKELEFVLGVEK